MNTTLERQSTTDRMENVMRRSTVALALGVSLFLGGCGTYLGKELRRSGFAELVPPNDASGPGTLVAIERRNGERVLIERICSKENAVGTVPVTRSSSAEVKIARRLSGEVSLDAEYLDQAKASAAWSRVKNISLELSNVKIIELDWDQAIKGRKDRTEECSSAVALARQGDMEVTMITSAFVADATFSVEFVQEGTLSAEAKREVLEDIAAKLGAKFEVAGERLIGGERLFWGVRDNSLVVLEPLPPGFSAAGIPAEVEPLLKSSLVTVN